MTTTEQDTAITVVAVFDVDADRQQELVDVLDEGADTVIRHRPGCLGVTLLRSVDGSRVVNHARWRSLEDAQATFADEAAQAFQARAAAIARPAPGIYTTAAVHTS